MKNLDHLRGTHALGRAEALAEHSGAPPSALPNLRPLREAALLTQRDLAKKSGITTVQICRIELGRHRPRVSTIRSLAKALNVPPHRLMGEGAR